MNSSPALLRLAALLGLSSIILGAMGAHGSVHDTLVAAGKLDAWEVAVRYHLPHSILLYVLALVIGKGSKSALWAWRLLFTGVLLFSGSIYMLALFGWKFLGPVTPLGGLTLMAGWLMLALCRWQKTPDTATL